MTKLWPPATTALSEARMSRWSGRICLLNRRRFSKINKWAVSLSITTVRAIGSSPLCHPEFWLPSCYAFQYSTGTYSQIILESHLPCPKAFHRWKAGWHIEGHVPVLGTLMPRIRQNSHSSARPSVLKQKPCHTWEDNQMSVSMLRTCYPVTHGDHMKLSGQIRRPFNKRLV